jgi:hypothetical protein
MGKDDALFRAVVLFRISGPTQHELKQYFPADGGVILYHTAHTYGPYAKIGPAKAAVTMYWKHRDPESYDVILQSVPADAWETI